MQEKYSVSELARLFGISTQTLRYYDKIGLFKPAYTDGRNHYRYYSYKQFFTLSMIIQLKQLNFSLESIQKYSSVKDIECLEQNLKAELEMIQKEIVQLQGLEEKTNRLLKKLQLSKRTTSEPICELLEEPDRFQYEIPMNFEIKDLYQYIKIMYESYIKSSFVTNVSAHGEIILKIHQENLCRRQCRVYNSIGFFLEQHTDLRGRGITKIEHGLFASCLHIGPYDTIHRTYQKIFDFIDAKQLAICGDSIEFAFISIALTDNSEDFLTQIQIPVLPC